MVLDKLVLKKKAKVLFIKNDISGKYINGNLGIVIGFTKENMPIVKTSDGQKIKVEKQNFILKDKNDKEIAEIQQIPLKLAWAITVHKSQGMTLESAEIDLSKTFQEGQGYVALSRIKTIEGLKLVGLNNKALKVNKTILFVDKKIKESSKTTEADFVLKKKQNIKEQQNKFLKNINYFHKKEKKEVNKRNIYLETKELLKKIKTIKELSKKRGLSEDSCIKHIEFLINNSYITKKEVEHIKPKKDILEKVKKAKIFIIKNNNKDDCLENKNIKLKSIYNCLNKKVDYQNIKLALLFI